MCCKFSVLPQLFVEVSLGPSRYESWNRSGPLELCWNASFRQHRLGLSFHWDGSNLQLLRIGPLQLSISDQTETRQDFFHLIKALPLTTYRRKAFLSVLWSPREERRLQSHPAIEERKEEKRSLLKMRVLVLFYSSINRLNHLILSGSAREKGLLARLSMASPPLPIYSK